MCIKKLSSCNKLKFSYSYIFLTWWCKPLIFLAKTIWSYKIYCLKNQRSTKSGCKDKVARKSKAHFRCHVFDENCEFLWLNMQFVKNVLCFKKLFFFMNCCKVCVYIFLPVGQYWSVQAFISIELKNVKWQEMKRNAGNIYFSN